MGSYKYSYNGVSNPKHAINLNNGRYVVADFGNNRVIELNSTLTTILKNYNAAINSPVFVDYNEADETLLITSESLNLVREITWSDLGYGVEIWHSTVTLNSPQSGTYRQGSTDVVISNTGDNEVVVYSRDSGLYTTFDHYNLYPNEIATTHDFDNFYKPFRSYQYRNGDICVIEREGRELGWEKIESSSSSSSSSS